MSTGMSVSSVTKTDANFIFIATWIHPNFKQRAQHRIIFCAFLWIVKNELEMSPLDVFCATFYSTFSSSFCSGFCSKQKAKKKKLSWKLSADERADRKGWQGRFVVVYAFSPSVAEFAALFVFRRLFSGRALHSNQQVGFWLILVFLLVQNPPSDGGDGKSFSEWFSSLFLSRHGDNNNNASGRLCDRVQLCQQRERVKVCQKFIDNKPTRRSSVVSRRAIFFYFSISSGVKSWKRLGRWCAINRSAKDVHLKAGAESEKSTSPALTQIARW